MKKAIITLGILLTLITTIKSQNKNDSLKNNHSNHLAIGFNINNFGNDFGLGLNLTSPYFIHHAVAIRVSENYQWLNHYDNTGTNVWSGYHNIRVGVLGGNFMLNNSIRLYGEGGIAILVGGNNFTSNNVVGGYGVFGFEFYPSSGSCYFIEMGGIGTGAIADKVPGKPMYSNGFMTSVGFRFHL